MSILIGRVRRFAGGLVTQPHRPPRPGQGQRPGTAQAEFVICDKTIESSYRLLEQVRGHTTARNAALRFLWMGIALLLGNIWIALHWTYLRRCGSGPRRVARKHFTLSQLAQFLRRAVEAIYGVISTIDPPNVKPAVL